MSWSILRYSAVFLPCHESSSFLYRWPRMTFFPEVRTLCFLNNRQLMGAFKVSTRRTGLIGWRKGGSLSRISVRLHFSSLNRPLTCGAPELGEDLSKELHTVQYKKINYITKACNYVCSRIILACWAWKLLMISMLGSVPRERTLPASRLSPLVPAASWLDFSSEKSHQLLIRAVISHPAV